MISLEIKRLLGLRFERFYLSVKETGGKKIKQLKMSTKLQN